MVAQMSYNDILCKQVVVVQYNILYYSLGTPFTNCYLPPNGVATKDYTQEENIQSEEFDEFRLNIFVIDQDA